MPFPIALPPEAILNFDFDPGTAKQLLEIHDALSDNPFCVSRLIELTAILLKRKQKHSAEELMHQILAIGPNEPGDLIQAGDSCMDLGWKHEAFKCFYSASRVGSSKRKAYLRLARWYLTTHEIDFALRCLELAAETPGEEFELADAAADCLFAAGRFTEAAKWAKDAYNERQSSRSVALFAKTLFEVGEVEKSLEILHEWLWEHPDDVTQRSLLAGLFMRVNRFDQCEKVCEEGLRFDPGDAKLHFNLACACIAQEKWKQGWESYEWRWQLKPGCYAARFPVAPTTKEWRGSCLPQGSRILVHCEQGAGDIFHFCRFLPALRSHFKKTIVLCWPELVTLLRELQLADEVYPFGGLLPGFDEHISLCSLPLALQMFSTNQIDQVCHTVYRPSVRYVKSFHAKKPLVGFAWGGNNLGPVDRRALPVEYAEKILSSQAASFVLVQKGERTLLMDSEKLKSYGAIDARPLITNWYDTAQFLLQLDSLITVDTGLAHLAGLMGVPTLLLLEHAADWRWLSSTMNSRWQSRTIWYKSILIIRQQKPSDWSEEIAQTVDLVRQSWWLNESIGINLRGAAGDVVSPQNFPTAATTIV